jgi:putative DNA primase/helicase
MDNLTAVLHQMENFGIELRDKDRSKVEGLGAGTLEGKRYTFGPKGKDWFKLYLFRPDHGRSAYITGSFGTYRGGGRWEKVEHDWAPLSEDERERLKAQRMASAAASAERREKDRRIAAFQAAELWRYASREGSSPYLERKGLTGEACRYLADGTLVILLLRYDLPREEAIQAAQRILPDGSKFYTKGFSKPGSALRLGVVDERTQLVIVCEGYATGLTIRTALDWQIPVYVAFDAGNLRHVVPLVRRLHSDIRILLCADDDWRTRDPITKRLINPGRVTARQVAKESDAVEVVYPIFDERRCNGDTDFDDLRQRQGIETCARQLRNTVKQLEAVRG